MHTLLRQLESIMNDEEKYVFEPENIFTVLDKMKTCNELLMTCETQYLCDLYMKLFPKRADGVYELYEAHVKALTHAVFDTNALALADRGLVELVWSDEENDFAWRATEAGHEAAKRLK